MAFSFNAALSSPIVSNTTIPKRLEECNVKKTFHEYVVVWLRDGDLDSEIEFELRQLINYIKVYENEVHCLRYIRTNPKEKIFLILSDSIAENFVLKIHHLDQIQFIYVFCEYFLRYSRCNSLVKVEKHRQWTKNYSKIVDVYDDRSKLFSKLQEDAHFLSISTISLTIFHLNDDEKSVRECDKDNGTLLWFYLLVEVLLRMPDKSTSKSEMIDECRLYYENDLIEQEKIRDFQENYVAEEAISWYTRDSFLFRTLNKALRTENIDIIYKFRFFLADLLNQLKFLQSEFLELLDEMVLTVYRGASISRNELENLKTNVGGLVSFNTFLSTSLEKNVALLFAGEGNDRPYRESVLFQIKIYVQDNLKPFANIKGKSFMKHEDEILFSLGTVFRIESVDNFDESVWLINLTLSGDEDQQLQSLRKYFHSKLDHTSSIHDLGDFLYQIGDYSRAESYYRMILNKYPSTHRDLVMVYCNMGVLQYCKDDYREASNYFTTALLLLSNSIPFEDDRDYIDFATINYNVGCSIAKFDGYKAAGRFFHTALHSGGKHIPPGHPILINMYNGYALGFADHGLFGMALAFHTMALEIVEAMSPLSQLDLATTYYSMGLTYKLKRDFSEALDYLQKAVKIRQLCLPENHCDLTDIWRDIADIYNHQGLYGSALQTYEKVFQIYLKPPLINYSRMTIVCVDIGNMYRKSGNYHLALNKYQQALDIIESNTLDQYNSLTGVYMNMGFLYECQHLYSQALIYLEKAVLAAECRSSKAQLDLAIIYHHMGLIHHKEQNQQIAMENLQKCLDIRLKFLRATHSDVIATYKDIEEVNIQKQTLKDTKEMQEQTVKSTDRSLYSENSNEVEVSYQHNTPLPTDTFYHQALDLRIRNEIQNE